MHNNILEISFLHVYLKICDVNRFTCAQVSWFTSWKMTYALLLVWIDSQTIPRKHMNWFTFQRKNSLQMWIDPLNTLGKHVNRFTPFFLDKYYCLDFMFMQARLMKHGFVRIKGNGFLNVVTDQDQYLYKIKANIDIKIEFHWIRLSQRNWRPNDSRVNGFSWRKCIGCNNSSNLQYCCWKTTNFMCSFSKPLTL